MGKIDKDAIELKDLAEVIRQNPGCAALIDSDNWWLLDSNGDEIASADDVFPVGDGYGSGSTHGGDVLQALARIEGIKVESV